MNWTIREFIDADYDRMAVIHDLGYPDYPTKVSELRQRDVNRDPKCRWARWVVEIDGEMVAYCGYHQSSIAFHPQRFGIAVTVHPDYWRRGIGSACYDHVMKALEPFDPIAVGMYLREDYTVGVRFLEKRGFFQKLRNRISDLDVPSFDFALYADVEAKVAAQGIGIHSLAELMESDPDYERKLFKLSCAIERDIPSPSEVTDPPFETWLKAQLHSRRVLPGGYFIAVDDGRYVGISNVYDEGVEGVVTPDLTGTLREYRRRGIALALKIAVIRWCSENGITTIRTYNEEGNAGMLAINDMLGFKAGPASVWFEKTLAGE